MIYLLTTILFILLLSFFSGIETGLVSLSKPRVMNGVKKGDRRAEILHFFLERPSLMLSTTLIGTNLCIVCTSLMVKQTIHYFRFDGNGPMIAATLVLTIVLLAAEIIPKDWFRQAPYLRCALFARPLYAAYLLLVLPARLLSSFTDMAVKTLTGGMAHQDSKILLREDFRMLLRESEEGGIISSEDANILDNAADFSQMTVQEIMIRKSQAHTVATEITVREAVAVCRESKCSRLPVTETGSAAWLGYFSIYDAIYKVPETEWAQTYVSSCLRPLNTIEAKAELSEVIRRSRIGKSPLLTVVSPVDGKTAIGIITPIDVVNYLFSR